MPSGDQAYINTYHGLELYPDHATDSRGNENGIYFLAHLIMLKKKEGSLDNELIASFREIEQNLRAYNKYGKQIKGIHDRGAKESLGSGFIKKTSHDNITGIFTGSILTGSSSHLDVMKFGKKTSFIYDNVKVDSPRLIYRNGKGELDSAIQWHPRDLFFWNWYGKNKRGVFLLYPLFWLMQLIDFITPERNTSSKLLGILRLASVPSSDFFLLKWIVKKMLLRQYGKSYLSKIYNIYFWQRNHPLPKLAKELEDKNIKLF